MSGLSRKLGSGIVQALLLTLLAGAMLFFGWGFSQSIRAEKAYTPNNLSRQSSDAVPAGIIRLHIIGNSDSSADQELKLKVRDSIMETFGGPLSEVDSEGEALASLGDSLDAIEHVADECLEAGGKAYGAKAALRVVHFPDKTYEMGTGEEVFLPEGDYTALQVVLGKGDGHNWWCVMYPPLCYFDLVQRATGHVQIDGSVVPASTVNGVLPVDGDRSGELPVELRSFFLDAIRSGIQRLTHALRTNFAGILSQRQVDMP